MAGATNGLTLVFTGDGKGKTTAALGLALRAWGQGMKVLMIQFIKGGWSCGELKAAAQLGPGFAIRRLGEGFIKDAAGEGLEAHLAAAQKALAEARRDVAEAGCETGYDMIILDEINYAVHYDLVALADVLELIRAKPPGLHLVLTGRHAAPEVVELADLVTEMKEIKHPYASGAKAQPGIEY
ncbi:MAG: cob(I)yrinic acid a,c-diamide adenosyltransferase [Firmicutes bacterium]|nr:cob(I)yrinic acid a,c-diamide adenosyltransferase [Bacillota bacterium]